MSEGELHHRTGETGETDGTSGTGGTAAPAVRQAVLDATVEALVDHGMEKLTVAEVAARAGVQETSVYRRWGTRENLVTDTLLTYSQEQEDVPVPDTGSVREDLVAFASSVAAYLSTPLGRALLDAAVRTADDPGLTRARAAFWDGRLDRAQVIVERAVARGELPETAGARLALEALLALLYARTLLVRAPLDVADLPRRAADLVLDGLRAAERDDGR